MINYKLDNQLQSIQRSLKDRTSVQSLDNTLLKVNNLIEGKEISTTIQKRLDNIIDSIFERKEILLQRSKEKQLELVESITTKSSNGENQIQEFLIRNNIAFIREQEFDGLINNKTGYRLRFDFYLPDLRACIEFDGKQHFQYTEEFDKGDTTKFKERKFRDGLKDKFCRQKGLILLRIKYDQFYNINSILKEFMKKYTLKPLQSKWYK